MIICSGRPQPYTILAETPARASCIIKVSGGYVVGTADGRIVHVSDAGVVTVESTVLAGYTINCLHYNGGVGLYFCCVGDKIYTSTNRTSWTLRLTASSGYIVREIKSYGSNQFVALAANSMVGSILYSSTNGTTWTARTLSPAMVSNGALFHTGSMWVLKASLSTAYLSTDAITWTYAVIAIPSLGFTETGSPAAIAARSYGGFHYVVHIARQVAAGITAYWPMLFRTSDGTTYRVGSIGPYLSYDEVARNVYQQGVLCHTGTKLLYLSFRSKGGVLFSSFGSSFGIGLLQWMHASPATSRWYTALCDSPEADGRVCAGIEVPTPSSRYFIVHIKA